MIDSDAIQDKCGICKGDGTKCSLVEGEFTETVSQSGKNSVDCAHGFQMKSRSFFSRCIVPTSPSLCSICEDRDNSKGSSKCAGLREKTQ